MKGIIQIYTGNGKGKTTAAIGQAIRAAGAGLRVAFFQFLKQGNFMCSEEKTMKQLPNINYQRFRENSPLFNKRVNMEELQKQVKDDLEITFAAIERGKYDLVILDELTHILNLKLVDEADLLNKLKKKPKSVELLITGRNAPLKLIKIADLVTDMKEVKHPFNKGLKARKGIDF